MLKRALFTCFILVTLTSGTLYLFRDQMIPHLIGLGASLYGISVENIHASDNKVLIKSIIGSIGDNASIEANEIELELGWPILKNAKIENISLILKELHSSNDPISRTWLFFIPDTLVSYLNVTLPYDSPSKLLIKELSTKKVDGGIQIVGNFSSVIKSISSTKFTPDVTGDGKFEAIIPKKNSSISLSGNFITSEANAKISPYEFNAIKTNGNFSYKDNLFSLLLHASSRSADGPLHLRELQGTLRWGSGKGIALDNLKTKALGGSAEIKSFAFQKTFKPFLLNFSNFDLSEILTAYAPDGITGDGSFSGSITIEATSSLPRISEGKFASDEAGHIKVDSKKVSLPDNVGTSVVKRALEDFQYSSINGSISSDENGSVIIKATFLGISPKIGSEQPIVLNLTIEENIPKLIESLKLLNQAPKG